MRFVSSHALIIFFLVIATILARPLFIFSASSIRACFEREARAFGLVRTVRKRKEYAFAEELGVLAEDPCQKIFRSFLPLATLQWRKWLQKLLLILSRFFSRLLSLNRDFISHLVLWPPSHRCARLSLFRI